MTRSSYGPEDRRLLETAASQIYADAVTEGTLSLDDPRLADDGLKPAVDLLVDIGLLRRDVEHGRESQR